MEEIKEIMLSSGFLDASVCFFNNDLLLKSKAGKEKQTDFAKTIICGIIPYYQKEEKGQNISLFAVSRDYHITATEYMEKAMKMLLEKYSGFKFIGFCDNSPINEVKAALRCGLGVRGKNNLLIHKKLK